MTLRIRGPCPCRAIKASAQVAAASAQVIRPSFEASLATSMVAFAAASVIASKVASVAIMASS